jgi:exodeoxyribonuclease V beta subunit
MNEESEWSFIIQKFSDLKKVWEKRGIESTIEKTLALFGVRERLAVQKDAERRITNLMHLSELAGKAEREQHVQGKTLLKWFYQKMSHAGSESEDEQLRLESDENLIQISTIHASKGLQYPIVLCPFLWDSGASKKKNDILKFHHNDENLIDISVGINHPERDEFQRIAEEQEKAEEIRLVYVALTRSVSACYIFLPDYKKIGESALASIISGFDSNKNMDYESIKEALTECEYIQLRKPVEQREISIRNNQAAQPDLLKEAVFKRKDVLEYPRMLSYSSLAEGKEHGEIGRDYDELLTTPKDDTIEFNKYGFPKGAGAGTCLHNIFEDIRFDNPINLEEVIRENLDYYGFESIWIETVKKWVKSTLDYNLGTPSLSLSQLKEAEVLKEMEFFFPVEDIEAEQLWKLIRDNHPESPASQSLSGYMKGFIDLTFRDVDTYYILDYKSNHLGNSPDDYALPKLTEAVTDAGYDLQYHIYTLALHRFLKTRMKGYNYEDHFGGVLYVFLRGVEENQPGSGVFFDRPDKKLIENMDHYFASGRLP